MTRPDLDEDWKVRAFEGEKNTVKRSAFTLAFTFGLTPDEIAELAKQGALAGEEAQDHYGSPLDKPVEGAE